MDLQNTILEANLKEEGRIATFIEVRRATRQRRREAEPTRARDRSGPPRSAATRCWTPRARPMCPWCS